MTKKKVLAISAVLGVAALVISAGTLSYFTDKTEAVKNTFTVGNVDIELKEQQRNSDRTALETFKQDKVLMPIVDSAQGEKDQFGLPTAENYVDKLVSVKNTGNSDAYVRLYIAFPSELDNDDPSLNIIHWNFGNYDNNGTWTSTYASKWNWLKEDGSWNYTVKNIDGINYNVYATDYVNTLAKGATTEYAIQGFYFDAGVDYKDGEYYKNGTKINFDFDKGVAVLVRAVAVQASGFNNANEAVTAAFGADFDPFAE